MVAARVGDVPGGEKVPALIIRKTGKSILFNSLLVPVVDDFKYSATPYQFKLLSNDKITEPIAAYRISSVYSDDLVYYSYNKNIPVKLGPIETNATMAMVRMEKGDAAEVFIAKGSVVKGKKWMFEITDFTIDPEPDIGTLQISVRKDNIEVKNDGDKAVILNFSKRKVKSLEMFKDGAWVSDEPIEVVKGVFTFIADSGVKYRLNF